MKDQSHATNQEVTCLMHLVKEEGKKEGRIKYAYPGKFLSTKPLTHISLQTQNQERNYKWEKS